MFLKSLRFGTPAEGVLHAFAQLQTVARQNGIDWRHEGTSHCVFVRNDGKTLSVPARRPIKPIYVKKFLELIEGT